MANTHALISLSMSAVMGSINSNVHYAFCTNLLCNFKLGEREKESASRESISRQMAKYLWIYRYIYRYVFMYVHICSCMSCVLANSLSPCACHKVICNLLPSKPMRLDSVASCLISVCTHTHTHTGYIEYVYI